MGAASYIGRVGRLAVVLGIGTAIATGNGVAWADGPASSPNSSSPNSSSGSAQSPGPGATSGSGTASDPGPSTAPESKEEPAEAPGTPAASDTADPGTSTTTTKTTTAETKTGSTTSSTVAPGVVISAQSTTGTAGGSSTAPSPAETATPTASSVPTATSSAPTTESEAPSPSPSPSNHDTSPPASATKAAATPSVKAARSSPAAPTTARPADPISALSLASVSAAASPTVAKTATARLAMTTDAHPADPIAPAKPDPLKTLTSAVSGVVSSVIGWALGPIAGVAAPTTPAEPPLAWTLLAFARREIDNFVAGVTGLIGNPVAAAETTSLSLTGFAPPAAALSAVNVPGFPLPGAQMSASTQFVNWITGDYYDSNRPELDYPNTLARFGIFGTDVGVTWDNGMVDDPTTPYDEHQILMAFGDTFGGPNSAAWRFNVLLRSSDADLSNGIALADGEWFNGNMFGGTPLGKPTFARQIIHPDGLPAGVTLIPTAGISIPTPGTEFGVTQYLNFMSVSQWGAPGSWTTNYSAIAYSTDNGENWTVAPTSVRYNQPWSGNQNFQQGAFVRPGDGYVYNYGTPNGRQGAAYVSRVAEKDILDLSKYEYYSKGSKGGWFGIGATPAGWKKNNPSAASPIFGQDTGACGVGKPGNQVSEMSVQYNKQLNKYVVLYGDQFNNIIMKTSDTPQGTWSAAKVLMKQQPGGIYAPMMNPWSPSTMGTGTDLYWNLSLFSEYNVMLMKTDLTKV
jgi:Domain of unknown function (DUF4185)